jgi:hypothetical protein
VPAILYEKNDRENRSIISNGSHCPILPNLFINTHIMMNSAMNEVDFAMVVQKNDPRVSERLLYPIFIKLK